MGTSGQQLGVLKLSDALREAQSRGLDLVEVAPTANPPVCKIVSLGKFRYDLSKHAKDKKPSGARLKEIKFRVNIDEHDYLTKVRGREMAQQEFGMQLMEKVKDDLSGMSQVEMEPKITGRNVTMTLAPLPANRRKRRFLPPSKEEEAESAESQNGDKS